MKWGYDHFPPLLMDDIVNDRNFWKPNIEIELKLGVLHQPYMDIHVLLSF